MFRRFDAVLISSQNSSIPSDASGLQRLLGPLARVGPFVAISLGQFVHSDYGGPYAFGIDPNDLPPRSRYLSDRTWHGWIELGVGGTLGL